ncbi:hypothetical protein F5878DRAFT_667407 [Lentinula raphanica]|uniref:Uncharacterized protein n=1 Tax=Lentinula raphanica TaxID=153919 RepID=A0AA38NW32_9AGAR|nr:hypothetical protein F5878DRAFT_667407 [Lentinula raphanica]
MLASVNASSSSSGRSYPSSAPPSSPFHSLTTIECANRACTEHAAHYSSSANPERRKKKRGPGKRAPRFGGGVDDPKVEDTIAVANDGTEVVSLQVLVYPPRLSPDEASTHGIPLEFSHYVQNRDAFQTVLGSVGSAGVDMFWGERSLFRRRRQTDRIDDIRVAGYSSVSIKFLVMFSCMSLSA